ncbi:hypothetical protein [Marinoscillum pacificum]|uniref:hypothetical protein n=1 Tax=Marinoscillum pacificum TaxID=392723 RepID=UPI002157B308|nr:hypothetical protein [Marinoscillum pacificum]
MRNSTLYIAAFVIIGAVITVSCDSSAQKLEKAQNAVIDADEDLVKANQDYLADMETYKKETDDKIAANQRSIVEFEARVAKVKKETKEAYALRVAELEQKNADLKKRLNDFKAIDKEQWDAFKMEFSKELDELGKSFKDLNLDNTEN